MAQDPKGDILIVDDTPANLRLLSQMLAEQGYRVRPVPDGSLALAAAQAEPPELILLDIRMPGMDGYQVCERLKADDQTRDVPIIFISALHATEDKVRAFVAGGVDYVTKPFQVGEVLARVETHLALRRLQKQLQDANLRMGRELALAGEVQASFLPHALPEIPGWQLAASLAPARETSGDFYDVFLLPNGHLGLVVADVAGKGAGAALLMALTCSLIRIYAAESGDQPELALAACNGRILADTRSQLFVTVFYGVLDPGRGTLTYCNAGHNLPYLLRPAGEGDSGPKVQPLLTTGPAIGLFEEAVWEQSTIPLAPGHALLIYTDGVTEAKDPSGALFGEERLQAEARANAGCSAHEIRDAVAGAVHRFADDAPQSDDIALVVLVWERNRPGTPNSPQNIRGL
jgi:sigma-B regulation protein RsbU (phosphoserine phosphatase)